MAPKSVDDRLLDTLELLDACLEEGDVEGARAALEKAQQLAGDGHPEVLYGRACIAWEVDGPDVAEPLLRALIEQDPEHADAHYALAALAEERDDAAAMVAHHLQVLALDARQDQRTGVGDRAELDAIEAVAREVLEALPSPFAEKLAHVPVVLEARPSRDLVEDGFDPRALGLFDGPTHGDRDTPAPTRIVLYVNNLLVDFPDDDELGEQVEITLLHEIGHYFGLDEDDMVRLGLD